MQQAYRIAGVFWVERSSLHCGFMLPGRNGLRAADWNGTRTEKLPNVGASPFVPHHSGQVLVAHTGPHVQHQNLPMHSDPKGKRREWVSGCNALRFNVVYTLRI